MEAFLSAPLPWLGDFTSFCSCFAFCVTCCSCLCFSSWAWSCRSDRSPVLRKHMPTHDRDGEEYNPNNNY
eukprot:486744-Amphidinium_carterae.1